MNNKFKVGDRVRVLNRQHNSDCANMNKGKTAVLEYVHPISPWGIIDIAIVKPDGDKMGIWLDELDLLEDNKVNYHLMQDSVVINHRHKTVAVRRGDVRFDQIVKAIKDNRLQDIPGLMSPADSLAKKGLQLVEGAVHIQGQPLPEALNKRLMDLIEAQMPTEILVRFWNNLKENPSFNSRQMLYAFLQHNGHPLTEDGCFIAYRGITEDFKDKHTRTMDNSPGRSIEVPRESVDDNPNNTCSHGLHVACFDYAKDFGAKLIEVKVNPRDVVAVPTDYNGTKMRVCKFEVLAECAGLIEGPVYKPETLSLEDDEEAAGRAACGSEDALDNPNLGLKHGLLRHTKRGPDGKFVKKSV